MSGYYVGPFGRMLHVDGRSSPPLPNQPANRSEPGDNSYQLPPPRTPGNLQFGSDPFLRRPPENVENGNGPESETTGKPQRTELPSVRHLLAPVTDPSSPPAYQQPFSTPTPPIEPREPSYPLPRHEPAINSQISAAAAQDRPKSCADSFPQPQSATLPPLAHMSMHSPRDMAHAATRSDSSASHFRPGRLTFQTAPFQDKAANREHSSPEGAKSKSSLALPHVVDERYIEGEGTCYVYSDGSHVPKAIDGIPVNANWGITKAGKPRKRLAQACLTCREKKIKCTPNLPKCDQCQKSGRECRFESAPRGSRSSMRGSLSAMLSERYDKECFSPGPQPTADNPPSMYNLARASNSATSLAGTSGHSPSSEGPMLTPAGADGAFETTIDADRAYRQQIYSVPRPFNGGDDSISRLPEKTDINGKTEFSDIVGDLQDINHDDALAKSWAIDPYDNDSETTAHYIESYFANVNEGLYYIFPYARFMLWLGSFPSKSAGDKMLLYSMMALGAIFSDRPDRAVAARQYARVARFAVLRSQHAISLQLAQSHLILGLLYHATGSLVGVWDSIGAAGRVISGLRYNVESGGVATDQTQMCDYGLHPQALIECRRRTFWVVFALDRASSFISASYIFLPSASALVRLPCRDEIYEAQQYATVPYLHSSLNQTSSFEGEQLSLSPLAFLIQIMSIWGDVSLEVLHLAHAPSESYARLAEEFHTTVTRRTQEWKSQLPDDLVFSAINLERASQAKKTDAFISIHMFYHATLMKLYRNARYQNLQSEVLVQYIHRARYHAVETLRVALAVMQYATETQSARPGMDSTARTTLLLSPFLGYMVLSAVDVLSAAGLLAELADSISFIRGALTMLQLLSHYWGSSMDLVNAVSKRLDSIIACLNERARTPDILAFAVDGPSLEAKVRAGALGPRPPATPATSDEDLFYGAMPRDMLIHSMRPDDFAIPDNSIACVQDP
ncbi:hypothetical protein N7492_000619 [Penicillium capsulatum]|uniref:Zn(2)-C6 fungal-type domain-containing protein n=1 Tax=Penicillium capsulatum TaxID=69766 RepID=A0A9W9IRL7_9EURO|nr:hypothetical protein N7492_000619 [Penicillium capsulatum]KAJ6130323.1 hypothetical protein N7512_003103 [Penicillium capsulatum]